MLYSDRDKFIFDYESGASSSYLVLKLDTDSQLLSYQIEMIANNRCTGIIPMEKRHVNDKIKLYYNITSLSAVEYYLKRKKLSPSEFIMLLRGIIKVISDCRYYFLNENSFLIDEKYIFINPATLEVSIIYVPLKMEEDVNTNYKAFVSNLILNTAIFDEGTSSTVTRILNYLREDNFNLAGFDKFLAGLSDKNAADDASNELSTDAEKKNVQQKQMDRQLHKQLPDAGSRPLDKPQVHHAVKNKQEKNTAAKKVYKRNSLLIAALAQVLVIIVIVLLLQMLPAMAEEDRISTAGGVGIILCAADFLLLRKLLDKNNLVETTAEVKIKASSDKKAAQNINIGKREICNKVLDRGRDMEEPQPLNIAGAIRQATVCEYGEARGTGESSDTVMLEEEPAVRKNAYLRSTRDGIIEKISINKESFIIGRLKDQADYISNNNAVGKLHAELIVREGRYFVKDLNSRNGTRINGKRISSNLEYEMNNNDRLAFANEEFIFINE